MGFYVFIVILTFWEGSSVWMYSCAAMHLIALSYYVNVIYSPTMTNTLLKSQWAFLNFLPNIFSAQIGNATIVSSLPNQIIASIGNNDFARSGGYLLLIMILIGFVTILVGLCSW